MIHRNILVVDDSEDWRDLFRSSLLRSNYHVDTAASYTEALEKLTRCQIELVIVDLRLDMVDENNRDGMSLLKDLNQRGINALVITGYGTLALQQQAKALKAITFIAKTVIGRSADKLKKIVNEIFSEMENRDRKRSRLSEAFSAGEAIGYPAEAAGYPLVEQLSDKVDTILES